MLWLQADRGITHTATVSAWTDQSGAGNNYAAGVAEPAYSASSWPGSKPNITYTGAEILVGSTSVLATTAITICVRTQYTQNSSEATAFGMQFVGFHYTVNQINGKMKFVGPSGGSTTTAATYNDGTPKSFIMAWDTSLLSGQIDGYVNGVLEAVLGTDTGTIAAANNDKNAIGGEARTGSADSPQFAGDIPLIFVYNRKLSAGEIAQANAYLNSY